MSGNFNSRWNVLNPAGMSGDFMQKMQPKTINHIPLNNTNSNYIKIK